MTHKTWCCANEGYSCCCGAAYEAHENENGEA